MYVCMYVYTSFSQHNELFCDYNRRKSNPLETLFTTKSSRNRYLGWYHAGENYILLKELKIHTRPQVDPWQSAPMPWNKCQSIHFAYKERQAPICVPFFSLHTFSTIIQGDKSFPLGFLCVFVTFSAIVRILWRLSRARRPSFWHGQCRLA